MNFLAFSRAFSLSSTFDVIAVSPTRRNFAITPSRHVLRYPPAMLAISSFCILCLAPYLSSSGHSDKNWNVILFSLFHPRPGSSRTHPWFLPCPWFPPCHWFLSSWLLPIVILVSPRILSTSPVHLVSHYRPSLL